MAAYAYQRKLASEPAAPHAPTAYLHLWINLTQYVRVLSRLVALN